MGAGILPFIKHKSIFFLILAKEQNSNLWSDFGGTSTKGESYLKTAIREGYEETDGLLGNKIELNNKVIKNLKKTYCTYDNRYKTYMFEMNFNEGIYFIKYFNNHRKFIEENKLIINKEGMYEKSEIKLFTINDLIVNYNKIRPFYREIIDQIIIDQTI